MITLVREWLTGVVAVTLLLFVIRTLLPEGTVRRIGEFTGGLVLLAALLQPLGGLALADLEIDLAAWEQEIEQLQGELEEAQTEELSAVIAERTAAYISHEADALGLYLQVTVETETTEEGVAVPAAVTLEGPYSERMEAWMETELNIPRERQVWHEREN